MRAFALEREHGVDHVLDHARAGDLAVLGDVADQNDGGARALGVADQRLRRAAHLRHRAGRGFHHVGPHGLDRIDDDQPRRLAVRQRGDDVFDGGFRRELDRRGAKPQAFGAQAHLRDRFLAGDIDGAVAVARRAAAAWINSVDLPMPGSPPTSSTEPRTKPPPVTRSNSAMPRGQARSLMRLAGERLEREQAALAGFAAGTGGTLGAFLGERVPLAAGLALALPAAEGGAAVLADEAEAALGHEGIAAETMAWSLKRRREQYKNIL